jgi:hypothetical protein
MEKPALAPCIQYIENHLFHSNITQKDAPVEVNPTDVMQQQRKLVATASWSLPDMDSILQHNDGLPSHL